MKKWSTHFTEILLTLKGLAHWRSKHEKLEWKQTWGKTLDDNLRWLWVIWSEEERCLIRLLWVDGTTGRNKTVLHNMEDLHSRSWLQIQSILGSSCNIIYSLIYSLIFLSAQHTHKIHSFFRSNKSYKMYLLTGIQQFTNSQLLL